MLCPNCGALLPDGAALCGNCGMRFEAGQPVYPQQRVPWHSRGKLSPLYPHRKRISVLLVLALLTVQVVLFFLFSAVGDSASDQVLAQAVGLVPTAVLIVYLFCLDTIEKEPPALLFKLFILEGLLAMTVVGLVELAAEAGLAVILDEGGLLFQLVDKLLCVALVEELFKYIVLKKLTWKHSAFNYRFDGIVYAAVTALGFAAFENFFYIMSYGFGTALVRSISAVPGHCVDGILMGIFYGRAKMFHTQGDRQKAMRCRVLSVLVPVAEHGFYDFFAGLTFTGSGILFLAYVLGLNAVVFVLVWRLAQRDEVIRQPQCVLR